MQNRNLEALEHYKAFNKITTTDYFNIKYDLERLEVLNNVWHNNEPMESVDINGEHLQELYDYISKINQENEKLKKVVDFIKNKVSISVNMSSVWLETKRGCVIIDIDNQQEYELLNKLFTL